MNSEIYNDIDVYVKKSDSLNTWLNTRTKSEVYNIGTQNRQLI